MTIRAKNLYAPLQIAERERGFSLPKKNKIIETFNRKAFVDSRAVRPETWYYKEYREGIAKAE